LGDYAGLPQHVAAANHLLTRRIVEQEPQALARPLDRIAIESALYWVFYSNMGYWGATPSTASSFFDPDFWLLAERALQQSELYPKRPVYVNSPVLGVSPTILKLLLSIKMVHDEPSRRERSICDDILQELRYWQEQLDRSDDLDSTESIYTDTGRLLVQVGFLLMEHSPSGHMSLSIIPEPVTPSSILLRSALDILKSHAEDDKWSRYYVGNWAVYTLGFFVSELSDSKLVRHDLQRRLKLTSSANNARIIDELESTWRERNIGSDSLMNPGQDEPMCKRW
jgi:hypothetical protein